MPVIYRHYFNIGMCNWQFFLPCLRFYTSNETSPSGWGAHILSCQSCFKKLPRTGYPESIPVTNAKIDLAIHYNGDPVEYLERIDLCELTVLWAWCHPTPASLQALDQKKQWKIPGWSGTGKRRRVMGEKVGWTYQTSNCVMGAKCVSFMTDYRYTYF
jgi:hypothetical protein